jgi:anaerobic ribonucleoside-triphosphate reductase activating protein
MSPGWASFSGGQQVTPGELLPLLFGGGEVQGLTISGGEPMLQAAGLARMVQQARRHRDLDVICYTGYRLEQLESAVQIRPGVADFLEEIDVLIDGPYIHELNDNRGLRGSTNQRVHFLTDRLVGLDFEDGPRSLELTIHDLSLIHI